MKASVRRLSTLGMIVLLFGLLLSACGGGGSMREVQGVTFPLGPKETSIANMAEQYQPADPAERCEYWQRRKFPRHEEWRANLEAWTEARAKEVCNSSQSVASTTSPPPPPPPPDLASAPSDPGVEERVRNMQVDEARQITKERAGRPRWQGDPRDMPDDELLRLVGNRFCGNASTSDARRDLDGEVCFNLGMYLVNVMGTRNLLATEGRRFETSCKLGYQAACTRPEIARAAEENQRNEEKWAAERATRAAEDCAEAERCDRPCAGVKACIGRCPLPPNGECERRCSSANRACNLSRCVQLHASCDRAQASAGTTPSPRNLGGNASGSQTTGRGDTPAATPPPSNAPPSATGTKRAGPVQHCVQNPDNNCSNKKFRCDVTKENLEHPGTDTSDGRGNRICCWLHNHP